MKKHFVSLVITICCLHSQAYSQTKETEIFRLQFGTYTLVEYKDLQTNNSRYALYARNANYQVIVDIITIARTQSLQELKNQLTHYLDFMEKYELDVSEIYEGNYISTREVLGIKSLYLSPTDRNDAHCYLNLGTVKKMLKKITRHQMPN